MNDCTFNSDSVRLLTLSQLQTWRSLVEDLKEDNLQEKFRSNRFTEHEEFNLYKEMDSYIEEVWFCDPNCITTDWAGRTNFSERTQQFNHRFYDFHPAFSPWSLSTSERIGFRSREMPST